MNAIDHEIALRRSSLATLEALLANMQQYLPQTPEIRTVEEWLLRGIEINRVALGRLQDPEELARLTIEKARR